MTARISLLPGNARSMTAPTVLSKHLGQLHCVIRDQNICARTLDVSHGFGNDSLSLNPTCACRGLDHRVFATNLIGGQGEVKLLTSTRNDIEIRESGLYHYDIRSLFNVQTYFTQSFPHIR